MNQELKTNVDYGIWTLPSKILTFLSNIMPGTMGVQR